jgi:hypothetical protein
VPVRRPQTSRDQAVAEYAEGGGDAEGLRRWVARSSRRPWLVLWLGAEFVDRMRNGAVAASKPG